MKLKESSVLPKPQYKMSLEGITFIVQFDTNINETKRGVKMRFHSQNTGMDAQKLNEIANKIAVVLQKQFAKYSIQIDRDTQVQDPSVIGFIIPLISISNFIISKVIKGD